MSACSCSQSQRPLRFVSAASLFDGHDAAINMIRRLLQAHGAEVVHLGHNRSVADIVRAAIQEDADGSRGVVLPGRPQRILRLHGRHAARAGRRATSASSSAAAARSRRTKIAGAGALRRREDLHAGGRPSHRPRRHDRRRVQARAPQRASATIRVRAAESRAITVSSRGDLGAGGGAGGTMRLPSRSAARLPRRSIARRSSV